MDSAWILLHQIIHQISYTEKNTKKWSIKYENDINETGQVVLA